MVSYSVDYIFIFMESTLWIISFTWDLFHTVGYIYVLKGW